MNKGNSKEKNKQNVNIGTKRTNDSESIEKSAKNKNK